MEDDFLNSLDPPKRISLNRIRIMQLGVLIERLEDYQRLLKQIAVSLDTVINEHYSLKKFSSLLDTRLMIQKNLQAREEIDVAVRAMDKDIAFWTKQHKEEQLLYNERKKEIWPADELNSY
jgi:hypothetical protein